MIHQHQSDLAICVSGQKERCKSLVGRLNLTAQKAQNFSYDSKNGLTKGLSKFTILAIKSRESFTFKGNFRARHSFNRNPDSIYLNSSPNLCATMRHCSTQHRPPKLERHMAFRHRLGHSQKKWKPILESLR